MYPPAISQLTFPPARTSALAALVGFCLLFLNCAAIEIPIGDPVAVTQSEYMTIYHPERLKADPGKVIDKQFRKLCDANDAWSLCNGIKDQQTRITLMSCQRMSLRFAGRPGVQIWGLTIGRALPSPDGPGVDIYLCSLDRHDILHELAHALHLQSMMGFPYFPSPQMYEAFAHGLQDVATDGPHLTWSDTRNQE